MTRRRSASGEQWSNTDVSCAAPAASNMLARMLGSARSRIDYVQPTLIAQRGPRGMQTSAGKIGLDEDDAAGQTRLGAIPLHKLVSLRLAAEREFAHQRTALLDNRLGQRVMLFRVNRVQSVGEYGDRVTARAQRGSMSDAVTAERQAADDAPPCSTQCAVTRPVMTWPSAVGARVPTIATVRAGSAAHAPRTHNSAGSSRVTANSVGYSASQRDTMRAALRAARSI